MSRAVALQAARETSSHRAETLARVLEALPDAIVLVSGSGQILGLNSDTEQLFGYRRDELLGRPLTMLVPGEDWERRSARLRTDLARGSSQRLPTRREVGLRRRGDSLPVEVRLKSLETRRGPIGVYSIRDLSDLKGKEETIEERLRFEQLISTISRRFIQVQCGGADRVLEDGLALIGEHFHADRTSLHRFDGENGSSGRIHVWPADGAEPPSPAASPMDLAEGEGARVSCVDDLPGARTTMQRYLVQRGVRGCACIPLTVEKELLGVLCLEYLDGSPRWERHAQWQLDLIGQIFSNVLHRLRAFRVLHQREAALQRSREAYRALVDKLLSADENERQRLSRELHDDLTQRLAVLAIQVGNLEGRCLEAPDKVPDELRAIREHLADLSADVHRIARRLHPSILDDLGLADAIQSECSSVQEHEGIAVRYQPIDVPAELPKDVALCLYRITQESLRNVARHSGASRASVQLQGVGGAIRLSIDDPGVGFDLERLNGRAGLGLASMAERAKLVGGELSIRAQPGRGTTIEVHVPVPGDRP